MAPPTKAKQPKEYNIPSRDWPITAKEAGDILLSAVEIKQNKALNKAALAVLRNKKKAITQVT